MTEERWRLLDELNRASDAMDAASLIDRSLPTNNTAAVLLLARLHLGLARLRLQRLNEQEAEQDSPAEG